jgi:hypothetical protein
MMLKIIAMAKNMNTLQIFICLKGLASPKVSQPETLSSTYMLMD